jgi:phosphatidylinositol 3-kinase
MQESEQLVVELRITSKLVPASVQKRSLLYKHDDDLRQELFAIEFIKLCDRILRACGLDLKMLTFECVPVSKNRGFIEWVDGSVPLSEICQQPFSNPGDLSTPIFLGGATKNGKNGTASCTAPTKVKPRLDYDNCDSDDDDDQTLSSVVRAGLTKYESLRRVEAAVAGISAIPISNRTSSGRKLADNSVSSLSSVKYVVSNPIQDFLRSFAYNENDPYQIQRVVMERFVKSCAGYTVCTYLLGVGDRHLDNLLLHPSGHFFHCDFSFILGQDPKKTTTANLPPMRFTQEMVDAMGGRDSDLYCQFLNLVSATFLTLRRPENVRAILSMIRVMYGSGLPDLEQTQTHEQAVKGLLDRLQLQLADDEAISFIESILEDSSTNSSNKMMWFAVDAIHSLGKRF